MRLLCLIAACGATMCCEAAHAEDDFVASVRLRGGFDTNPQFSNSGIGGSAFIGTDTALAAGTKGDGYSYGVTAEASTTQYANPLSTTTVSGANTYNLRSSDLIQSIKGEVLKNNFKIFATVEGARSNLNQTNAIFQDFLPSPRVYLRGTFIPGMSYVHDKFEIGASINLSARRYELDDFGYRRDKERVQPFLFAKYEDKDFTFFGAISQLRATFHDVDFTSVNATMFDAKLTWRISPVTVDLAAYRRAGETTFPISPMTIDTAYTAKASWLVEPKLTLSAAVGFATTDYLDSPYSAQTLSYGIGASHDLGGGYAFGLDLTRAQGVLISGDKASAVIISSSLTKKFTPLEGAVSKDSKDKKAVTKG